MQPVIELRAGDVSIRGGADQKLLTADYFCYQEIEPPITSYTVDVNQVDLSIFGDNAGKITACLSRSQPTLSVKNIHSGPRRQVSPANMAMGYQAKYNNGPFHQSIYLEVRRRKCRSSTIHI